MLIRSCKGILDLRMCVWNEHLYLTRWETDKIEKLGTRSAKHCRITKIRFIVPVINLCFETYHDARNCSESMIQPKTAIEPLLRLLPRHFSEDAIVERSGESAENRTDWTPERGGFTHGLSLHRLPLNFACFSRAVPTFEMTNREKNREGKYFTEGRNMDFWHSRNRTARMKG